MYATIRASLRTGLVVLATMLCPAAANAGMPAPYSPLDTGFQSLYNLDFDGAQNQFSAFERDHPDDPIGPAAEAAAYAFSEFNRLGVLEARFFTNDSAFRSRKALFPDPALHQRFGDALDRADSLARTRLAANPRDKDGLFALTLAAGLRADYASLIEDHNMAALRFAHQATASAQQLLEVCADCYDAYVATGISQYLVGTLSPPVRWLVRLGGYSGDKARGIHELQLAAEHGRYLAPFARILLAIAYVRDKKPEQARQVLEQLRGEFPANPLFSRELARLEQ